MTYDTSYSYGHTISQTFNHLEGVCGNYADLAAVMCMMAGLVSRVVVGWCDTPPNYFSFSYITSSKLIPGISKYRDLKSGPVIRSGDKTFIPGCLCPA